MVCQFWCCSPRTGARIVGILDLLGGIAGIIYGGYLLVRIKTEDAENKLPVNATSHYDDTVEDLMVVSYGYIFPSVFAMIVGMTTLISISKNNICIGRLAYFLNVFFILGAIVAFVGLFVLGFHWINIIDLLIVAIIQSFFVCALHDFIKLELSIESV